MQDGIDGMTALVLGSRLDLPMAGRLHTALLARSGAALEIDAGSVSHLGALCLQVLLAAGQSWRKSGHPLIIRHASDPFGAALDVFGVEIADLQSLPAERA